MSIVKMELKKESKKVLVIGLDGATFEIIKPLAEKGKLPIISKLMNEGVYGELKSTIPPATLPAWPSFMTGKNPGKHGVFDFMGRESNEYYGKIMTSRDIKGKVLWRILSDFGKRSIVINVPATYPPEKINGIIISGMLTPPGKRYTSPPELDEEINGYIIEMNPEIVENRWKDPIFLEELYSMTQKRKETALYLMNKYKWDFFMVMFRGTDIIQHKLWGSKKISQYYQKIDEIIDQLLQNVDKNITVIIMSDHGFGELKKMFCTNKWLHDLGLSKYKTKEYSSLRITRLNKLRDLETNDSITRLLCKLGFTQNRIQLWIRKLGFERFINFMPKGIKKYLKNIKYSMPKTDLDTDWTQTKAYFSSFFTAETQGITINLRGREPKGIVEPTEYEELRDYIIEKIHELKDPENGGEIVEKVFKREQIYHGPYLDYAPDIVMLLKDGYKAAGDFLVENTIIPLKRIKGVHRINGVFMVHGPNIKQGKEIKNSEISDLAPTILHIFGIPIPRDMDGRVLTEIFEEDSELANKQITFQKIDEKERIKKRIRELEALEKI